jgi:Darcynin, domain of unknown function
MPSSSPSTPVLDEHRDGLRSFHIFVLVKTTRHWLDLKVEQRHAFLEGEMRPLLRQRPELRVRWFEPEFFTTRASDILLCETEDLSAWAWFCDQLRDTRFWDHYFDVVDILPAVEANYFAAA